MRHSILDEFIVFWPKTVVDCKDQTQVFPDRPAVLCKAINSFVAKLLFGYNGSFYTHEFYKALYKEESGQDCCLNSISWQMIVIYGGPIGPFHLDG